MSYKAKLILNIYNEDRTKCVSGVKEVEFPFAPYEGLEITVKWTCTYKLKSVTWSIDEQYFHCIIEDQENDSIDDDAILASPITMDFLVSEARSCGWNGFEKIMQL